MMKHQDVLLRQYSMILKIIDIYYGIAIRSISML
jgi:hypothetical protein